MDDSIKKTDDSGSRSSEAERADPPLHRQEWRLSAEQSWSAFVAEARLRWTPGPEAFDRVLWHGGLQLAGRPLDPERPPAAVPGGSGVIGWGFVREPRVPQVASGAVLLDRAGLVAVDKPAWLPMQRTRASARHSLEQQLRALLDCPGLVAVHRLDRQTSGVALFARTRELARHMQRELAAHRVRKGYLAWVSPPPAWRGCRAAGWIRRASHGRRVYFALDSTPGIDGRWSETRLRVGETAAARALLEARPISGRTHQVRVHLAALGHPVVGDDLYGRAFATGAPHAAGRCLLHAREVALRLPGEAGATEIHAPLPGDFVLSPGATPSERAPARSPGSDRERSGGARASGSRPGGWRPPPAAGPRPGPARAAGG